MTRRTLIVLCLMLLDGVSAFATQGDNVLTKQDNTFHVPKTPAEKSLNEILNRSFADDNMIQFLLHTPHYDHHKDTEYAQLFTQELRASLTQAEVGLVKENCHGQYSEGDVCGFDFVPTTCSQDWPDDHVVYYRTDKQTDTEAIIEQRWTEQGTEPAVTYRLVYQGQRWKLDGIQCSGGNAFNMR
jgi:hypothetical protein